MTITWEVQCVARKFGVASDLTYHLEAITRSEGISWTSNKGSDQYPYETTGNRRSPCSPHYDVKGIKQ